MGVKMQDLIRAATELEGIRDRLLSIKSDFPGLYGDFLKSLGEKPLPDKPVTSLTQREQVKQYLSENPDSTLREITEGTGLERNQVSGLLYTQNKESQFFYKTSPPNTKPAKWRNTLPNGGKPFVVYGVNGCVIETGISPRKSVRERVRLAGSEFCDIDTLTEKSGVSKQQVRGVINAPREKDNWERRDSDGVGKLYRYSGGKETL